MNLSRRNISFPGGLIIYCYLFTSLSLAAVSPISNISLSNQNTTDKTLTVQFDLSWENSWRNNVNYDAIWVFLKYSLDSGSTWKHATLKSAGKNPAGFSPGTGTGIEIVVPADKKGAFLQRDAPGQGTVTVTGIKLIWDWGTDGLTPNSSARLKVFGIEMVYIASGAFSLGDGSGSAESTFAFHLQGADNTAVVINTSPKDITCDLNGNDDIDSVPVLVDGDGGLASNPDFPAGYSAFYSMKYEITEDAWVDFFNTLSSQEKLIRDITGASGKNSDSVVNRNTVSWVSGNAATQRGARACGFLSWMDLAAFADWAALRPMTELEYEKVCRGPINPLPGEYAWGGTNLVAAETISGTEDGTETVTAASANCSYDNVTLNGGDAGAGPLRTGIFAKADSTRISSGSSYYGVRELSGNLKERVVTLGNARGRVFSGTHGDGLLSLDSGFEGNATNNDWPGLDGSVIRGVTGADGSGLRGGGFSSADSAALRVSDRSEAALPDISRNSAYGGRCARTAP